MAGDWIKIERSLPGKPEVMELARILDIDDMAVVGHLVCFWSWVDENLSPDCPSTNGTKRGLDRVAGRDGFADAMVAVGWLTFDGHTVQIPNYEHHLSKSAKTRAIEARKKRNQRNLSRFCPSTNGTKTGQHEGPEKRRVLDGVPPVSVSKRFAKPTIGQLDSYAIELSHPEFDSESFMDYYDSVGWTVGKNKPMKDWKAAVRTWIKRNTPKPVKKKSVIPDTQEEWEAIFIRDMHKRSDEP